MRFSTRIGGYFKPSLYWGAEFLNETVRICALAIIQGKPSLIHAFEGSYSEAEIFALKHSLLYEGLYSCVSHIPFKIERTEKLQEGNEDVDNSELEKVKPQGLPIEAVDSYLAVQGEEYYFVLTRDELLRSFLDKLPPNLSTLWNLVPTPLVFLSEADRLNGSGFWAALISERDYSHLMFFKDSSLVSYLKLFKGWEIAGQDSSAMVAELKMALVYYFGSRFPDISLDAIQIFRDGPNGEVVRALQKMDIPKSTPKWGVLEGIPDTYRAAATLALQGMSNQTFQSSFSIPNPVKARARRKWNKRAGLVARTGYLALVSILIGVTLLMISALAMRFTVELKARKWSGELKRWSEFQQYKSEVESEIKDVKGLLTHRSESYHQFQRIADLLPSDLWFESWEFENVGGSRFNHRLEGFTLVEARVPELLGNLEKSGHAGSVKLKSTERIKGDLIEERTKIKANRRDVIRFQIGISE